MNTTLGIDKFDGGLFGFGVEGQGSGYAGKKRLDAFADGLSHCIAGFERFAIAISTVGIGPQSSVFARSPDHIQQTCALLLPMFPLFGLFLRQFLFFHQDQNPTKHTQRFLVILSQHKALSVLVEAFKRDLVCMQRRRLTQHSGKATKEKPDPPKHLRISGHRLSLSG